MITTPEYNEIKQREAVLQGIIDGHTRDKERYDDMKKAAQDSKVDCEARLELYTNHLSDAVAEYEAAHPPENS